MTAKVTAQAVEDGSTSDTASVSSSIPDSNTTNNTASATTSFSEPAISVSGPIRTKNKTLSTFQVATFTHANGVEPASAFVATINWGDGTTSTGTIALSGSTYTVTGSHTYTGNGNHSITTTVTESGNSPDLEGGSKFDTEDDGKSWKMQDLVSLPGNSGGRLTSSPSPDNSAVAPSDVSVVSLPPAAAASSIVVSVPPSDQQPATADTATVDTDQGFSPGAGSQCCTRREPRNPLPWPTESSTPDPTTPA